MTCTVPESATVSGASAACTTNRVGPPPALAEARPVPETLSNVGLAGAVNQTSGLPGFAGVTATGAVKVSVGIMARESSSAVTFNVGETTTTANPSTACASANTAATPAFSPVIFPVPASTLITVVSLLDQVTGPGFTLLPWAS